MIAAPTEFVQGCAASPASSGIPLIVDEVQSGCGRTGTWFAFEQHGIEPDVIVASKAIGGHRPAVRDHRSTTRRWTSGRPARTPAPSAATSSRSSPAHRPSRSSAATACWATSRARRQSHAALEELATTRASVEVRGRGLMWGIELADHPPPAEVRRKAPAAAAESHAAAGPARERSVAPWPPGIAAPGGIRRVTSETGSPAEGCRAGRPKGAGRGGERLEGLFEDRSDATPRRPAAGGGGGPPSPTRSWTRGPTGWRATSGRPAGRGTAWPCCSTGPYAPTSPCWRC